MGAQEHVCHGSRRHETDEADTRNCHTSKEEVKSSPRSRVFKGYAEMQLDLLLFCVQCVNTLHIEVPLK